MQKEHYVYTHRNPVTGEIFYIGAGRDYYRKEKTISTRDKDFANRGDKWFEVVHHFGYPLTERLVSNLTKEEAGVIERKLIKELQPEANIQTRLPRDQDTRDKIKKKFASKMQAVRQYTLKGKFVAQYESLHEANRQTGIDVGSISQCIRGKALTAGGFTWRFA
jgi:hypothetical protein